MTVPLRVFTAASMFFACLSVGRAEQDGAASYPFQVKEVFEDVQRTHLAIVVKVPTAAVADLTDAEKASLRRHLALDGPRASDVNDRNDARVNGMIEGRLRVFPCAVTVRVDDQMFSVVTWVGSVESLADGTTLMDGLVATYYAPSGWGFDVAAVRRRRPPTEVSNVRCVTARPSADSLPSLRDAVAFARKLPITKSEDIEMQAAAVTYGLRDYPSLAAIAPRVDAEMDRDEIDEFNNARLVGYTIKPDAGMVQHPQVSHQWQVACRSHVGTVEDYYLGSLAGEAAMDWRTTASGTKGATPQVRCVGIDHVLVIGPRLN